jgi:hypothetical protein
MSRFYIGHVEISAAMGQKITSKHGVTPDEVREACQTPGRYLRASWHDDPRHGRRLLVIGRTNAGRVLKIVLQPVDVADGTWRLRTALAQGPRKSR